MQKKMMLLTMILSLSYNFSWADSEDHASHFFGQLYANTCLKNAADMQILKDSFSSIQTPHLSAPKAALFLQGKPGTVWVIPNVVGDYLVSIDRHNYCAVYTQGVNINAVERGFITLLENTPSSFTLEKVQDETLQTALGPTHIIRYLRTNIADNSRQEFSLETSNAQGVEIQVKAEVGPVMFAGE